jgi:hypothetical protein
MSIISLLSDFGKDSSYVAQMKAVILSITKNVNLIDISHNITPHAIDEGAFVLATSIPFFPPGTIHVGVVDPGVGTERRCIIVEAKDQILVGPDNGLLIPAAKRLGDFKVYEIENKKYMLPSISTTFHGRDIFAPVAAHIANGVSIKEIGREIDNFANITLFEDFKILSDKLVGRIIYVDTFGNLITNIKGSELLRRKDFGSKLKVNLGNKKYELKFVKSYGFVEKKEILLTIGGSGYVEISVNQGNASKELKINKNEKCIIQLD